MAISRSLMNRQLQANGGIMNVTPRENFGLGSSLKRFVRKIIPNEISEIAVKAAPFVAPFNPGVAAAMSGIGGFDQTGKMGSSFKNAAMTYGLGQGARYLGGAGFQGNPFAQGGAFTSGGFQGGFSSPIGTSTGLGKLFSKSKPNAPIKGVNSGRAGDSASSLSRSGASGAEQIAAQGRAINAENTGLFTEGLTGGADGVGIIQDTIIDKSVVTKEPGFLKNMFDGISNQDYGKVAKTIGDGAKKFGKAMFTNKDGSIDKAAVMGAIAFAGSYAEALALADEAEIEITVEEYDEAKKAEKQEEYAGYLTNFFAGQKDGGRIGYAGGANESIEEKIAELEFLTNKLMTEEGIQDRGYASKLASDIIGMKNENIDPNKLKFLNNESALSALPRDMRPEDEYYDTLKALENRADGGRIGYEQGANELIKDKLIEDIMQDTSTEEMIMIMTEDGPKMVKKSDLEAMPGMFRDTTTSLYGDAARGRPVPEFANGGRIGYGLGDLVRGSAGVFQPTSASMSEGDAPVMPSSGMGGMLSKLINNNPQLFKNVSGQNNSSSSPMPSSGMGGMFSKFFSNPRMYNQYFRDKEDFIDENFNDIDDREEVAMGGRVSRRFGSPEEGEGSGVMEMLSVEVDAGGDEEEDMLMAYTPGFSSQEKSYLFRKLGGAGGSDRSFTMPQLYRVLKNPADYPEDAAVLKEIAIMGLGKKDGGRIGLKDGSGSSNRVAQLMLERDYLLSKDEDVSFIDLELERDFGIQMKAEGGIMEAKVPTGQMRKNNAGVAERDYRQTGGFVPVGIKERADDVPAMLSKNEFVMTADAVRGLGNGSVEEGSKKLYNTMKQAEQVGKA